MNNIDILNFNVNSMTDEEVIDIAVAFIERMAQLTTLSEKEIENLEIITTEVSLRELDDKVNERVYN